MSVEKEQDQYTYVTPLVITYRLALYDVSCLLRRHFAILTETEELMQVFFIRPLVLFHTGKTL